MRVCVRTCTEKDRNTKYKRESKDLDNFIKGELGRLLLIFVHHTFHQEPDMVHLTS